MKLKKFLKYIDGVDLDLILWVGDNAEGEPDYQGNIWDVPEKFLEKKMIKADTDDFDGIRIYNELNEYGVTIRYLVIALE